MTETIRPPAPEAKITLDRERTLRCDLYAMRLFKKETGLSLLAGDLGGHVNEDTIAELVWAFLAHEDPELTVEAVSKEIHPGNMAGILEEVFGLIVESLPEKPDVEKAEGDTDEGAEEGDHPLAPEG